MKDHPITRRRALTTLGALGLAGAGGLTLQAPRRAHAQTLGQHETVDEALCREVREETGLEVEIVQLVGVYSKPLKQEVVLAFRCRAIGGTPRATQESRVTGVRP